MTDQRATAAHLGRSLQSYRRRRTQGRGDPERTRFWPDATLNATAPPAEVIDLNPPRRADATVPEAVTEPAGTAVREDEA